MIKIGIDPGVNCGWAEFDTVEKKFKVVETISMAEAIIRLVESDKKIWGDFLVNVEAPQGNKPVFADKLKGQNLSKSLKIAQNVGQNKSNSILLIEICQKLKIKVNAIVPKTEKWDAPAFKKITKYKGRTSQHSRDACKLCFY